MTTIPKYIVTQQQPGTRRVNLPLAFARLEEDCILDCDDPFCRKQAIWYSDVPGSSDMIIVLCDEHLNAIQREACQIYWDEIPI